MLLVFIKLFFSFLSQPHLRSFFVYLQMLLFLVICEHCFELCTQQQALSLFFFECHSFSNVIWNVSNLFTVVLHSKGYNFELFPFSVCSLFLSFSFSFFLVILRITMLIFDMLSSVHIFFALFEAILLQWFWIEAKFSLQSIKIEAKLSHHSFKIETKVSHQNWSKIFASVS